LSAYNIYEISVKNMSIITVCH